MTDSHRFTDHDGRQLVPVENAELERAISVWLKTMPKHVWASYEKMLAIDPKRRDPEDRVDPREILAAALAACFAKAKWKACYPEPPGVGKG